MKLSTRKKVHVARLLSKALISSRKLTGKGPEIVAIRNNATWRLDLREGIDLAVYLGVYERSQKAAVARYLRVGGSAIDVGANIGVYTLAFASAVGDLGRVLSIEPTAFAYAKLQQNLALNPELASRVQTHQAFLTGPSEPGSPPLSVYSSWPVASSADLIHPTLMGRMMGTEGAVACQLDEIVASLDAAESGFSSVDLIKVDVDGHELSVLEGAMETVRRFSPVILLEFAPHLHSDSHRWALDWIDLLSEMGYELRRLDGQTVVGLTVETFMRIAPHGASIDLLAMPVAKRYAQLGEA